MKTKSPLKKSPLHNAGQSLERALDDHFTDNLLFPLLVIAISLLMVAWEWWRYFNPRVIHPMALTIVALPFVIGSVCWFWVAFKKAKQLKQGLDGERAVGQYLEGFRIEGFHVLHDIGTGDANIDHVLIGPQGVYTIETKTLSKPTRGEANITVANDGILANGRKLDRNPIIQAKAQANWLKNYFAEAGLKVRVQPVVVFPGWWVEPADFAKLGVWVLEPKALKTFIGNSREAVAPETAKALMLVLANYIRSQSRV